MELVSKELPMDHSTRSIRLADIFPPSATNLILEIGNSPGLYRIQGVRMTPHSIKVELAYGDKLIPLAIDEISIHTTLGKLTRLIGILDDITTY